MKRSHGGRGVAAPFVTPSSAAEVEEEKEGRRREGEEGLAETWGQLLQTFGLGDDSAVFQTILQLHDSRLLKEDDEQRGGGAGGEGNDHELAQPGLFTEWYTHEYVGLQDNTEQLVLCNQCRLPVLASALLDHQRLKRCKALKSAAKSIEKANTIVRGPSTIPSEEGSVSSATTSPKAALGLTSSVHITIPSSISGPNTPSKQEFQAVSSPLATSTSTTAGAKGGAGTKRKATPAEPTVLDPDKHCGVVLLGPSPGPGQAPVPLNPCTRSLGCKIHSLSLKRAVVGRSYPFDIAYERWKQAKPVKPPPAVKPITFTMQEQLDMMEIIRYWVPTPAALETIEEARGGVFQSHVQSHRRSVLAEALKGKSRRFVGSS